MNCRSDIPAMSPSTRKEAPWQELAHKTQFACFACARFYGFFQKTTFRPPHFDGGDAKSDS